MQQIKIDFDNPGLPQRLDVVENDSQSRFFQATLYKDGKAYTAPSGATYSIMYRGFGPQNEGWYDTINDGAGKRAACTVSGNVVTCEIARQALRVPGHVSVVLCVTGSNGYMLHGWPIDCNCRNDSYTGGTSVESFFYITKITNSAWTSAIQTWEELKNMIDPTLSIEGKAADAEKVGKNCLNYSRLASDSDLNTITNPGFYYLNSTVFQTLTNTPVYDTAYNGGHLEVRKKGNGSYVMQYLFDVKNKRLRLAYREQTSAEKWNGWGIYTFENYDDSASVKTYRLASDSDLNTITNPGFYYLNPTVFQTLTNTPVYDTAYNGGYLEVHTQGGGKYVVQYLFDILRTTTKKLRITYRQQLDTDKWSAWEIFEFNPAVEKEKYIKICAIGDSITYGVYSNDDGTTNVATSNSYFNVLCDELDVLSRKNLSVRGIGFIDPGNGGQDLVADILLANSFDDYNLIYVMLGANDYPTSYALGDKNSETTEESISGRIHYTIDFLSKYSAKLVMVSPLNTWRYGSATTKWDNGYSKNGKTLKDIADLIKYWCEYYNVEYIDENASSCISINNIQSAEYDKLHPSLVFHNLLGHELAKKISF